MRPTIRGHEPRLRETLQYLGKQVERDVQLARYLCDLDVVGGRLGGHVDGGLYTVNAPFADDHGRADCEEQHGRGQGVCLKGFRSLVAENSLELAGACRF